MSDFFDILTNLSRKEKLSWLLLWLLLPKKVDLWQNRCCGCIKKAQIFSDQSNLFGLFMGWQANVFRNRQEDRGNTAREFRQLLTILSYAQTRRDPWETGVRIFSNSSSRYMHQKLFSMIRFDLHMKLNGVPPQSFTRYNPWRHLRVGRVLLLVLKSHKNCLHRSVSLDGWLATLESCNSSIAAQLNHIAHNGHQ